jgi:hypothetical protein
MKHLKSVSRTPALAQFGGIGGGFGNISVAEQAILLLLGVFFGDWQNYQQVITNLQKYYRKTPD